MYHEHSPETSTDMIVCVLCVYYVCIVCIVGVVSWTLPGDQHWYDCDGEEASRSGSQGVGEYGQYGRLILQHCPERCEFYALLLSIEDFIEYICLLYDCHPPYDIVMIINSHKKCIYYAPGDDSPHGGILLLLCPYVRTYVRVWLKFLVKVLYWFKWYLMLSKHFRWTV